MQWSVQKDLDHHRILQTLAAKIDPYEVKMQAWITDHQNCHGCVLF